MGLLTTHILRGAQLLFGLLVLALGAAAAADWNKGYDGFYGGYTPSQTAFGIFLGLWTMLVVAYFMVAPRFVEAIAHPIIRLAVDTLTMLFWFAGFIALAVLASGFSYVNAIDNADGVIIDDNGWNTFYKETAAMAAFGALEWILFVATTVLTALEVFKGKRTTSSHAAANPEVHV